VTTSPRTSRFSRNVAVTSRIALSALNACLDSAVICPSPFPRAPVLSGAAASARGVIPGGRAPVFTCRVLDISAAPC
jgi:hypothetical protein